MLCSPTRSLTDRNSATRYGLILVSRPQKHSVLQIAAGRSAFMLRLRVRFDTIGLRFVTLTVRSYAGGGRSHEKPEDCSHELQRHAAGRCSTGVAMGSTSRLSRRSFWISSIASGRRRVESPTQLTDSIAKVRAALNRASRTGRRVATASDGNFLYIWGTRRHHQLAPGK